jgi:hypothetical protein
MQNFKSLNLYILEKENKTYKVFTSGFEFGLYSSSKKGIFYKPETQIDTESNSRKFNSFIKKCNSLLSKGNFYEFTASQKNKKEISNSDIDSYYFITKRLINKPKIIVRDTEFNILEKETRFINSKLKKEFKDFISNFKSKLEIDKNDFVEFNDLDDYKKCINDYFSIIDKTFEVLNNIKTDHNTIEIEIENNY